MSKTTRVAELALRLVSSGRWESLPLRLGIPAIAADAAALVRLADAVTACDVVECNGGAVDGDDRYRTEMEAFGCSHRIYDAREARVARAEKRRARSLAKAAKVAESYGLSVWHQPDPRGASLYLYDAAKHGEPHAGWDQHAPGVVCV